MSEQTSSRRERFRELNHRCMAMGIWINTPENDPMKLEDLLKMSTKELTALYNEHAERQVKRMESRAKLEERTAQLLRDAGKLEESEGEPAAPTAARGSKKTKTERKPIEAPEPNPTEEEAPVTAKPKTNRGAPVTNHTYKAISEKSKKFNPEGLKLQASSARGVVLEAIRKAENGKTRNQLESMFSDYNVKSALDVLVKYGFIEVGAA